MKIYMGKKGAVVDMTLDQTTVWNGPGSETIQMHHEAKNTVHFMPDDIYMP